MRKGPITACREATQQSSNIHFERCCLASTMLVVQQSKNSRREVRQRRHHSNACYDSVAIIDDHGLCGIVVYEVGEHRAVCLQEDKLHWAMWGKLDLSGDVFRDSD